MKQLRWVVIGLSLASIFFVLWRASWITNLSAPGMSLGVVHQESAPLWLPPADDLSDLLAGFNRNSEWHRVEVEDISVRVEPRWVDMLVDLLLLLVPATLFPGWVYTRVRGRRSDVILHTGVRVGLGLAIGFGLSFLLWLLFGGWGPPLLVPLSSLGGLAGLVTGVYSYGRKAAQLHNAADDARVAADRPKPLA